MREKTRLLIIKRENGEELAYPLALTHRSSPKYLIGRGLPFRSFQNKKSSAPPFGRSVGFRRSGKPESHGDLLEKSGNSLERPGEEVREFTAAWKRQRKAWEVRESIRKKVGKLIGKVKVFMKKVGRIMKKGTGS